MTTQTPTPANEDREGETRPVKPMRIGEVAELTGVTPRTIRYYEEIGLLGPAGEREQGKHRCYSEQEVERLQEIVRLRDLLGLSLEELSQLVEAQAATAEIRREYRETDDPERHRALLNQSLVLIASQLGLVRGRLTELAKLEQELIERQQRITGKLDELA
jgi:MerR family transcriptional regulator, repressor of the yfmOP operon